MSAQLGLTANQEFVCRKMVDVESLRGHHHLQKRVIEVFGISFVARDVWDNCRSRPKTRTKWGFIKLWGF